MPTPIGRANNTPVSQPQDASALPLKKSEEYSADAANAARPRVGSPAARPPAKTLKPREYWKEESRAAELKLREARGTGEAELMAVQKTAAAYLERSKVDAPLAEQLAYVAKALQLFKGSHGGANFDSYVPTGIIQRYLEITFQQATGTKWTPDWDKTKFKCNVKDFNPEAFLKYIEMLKRPGASSNEEYGRAEKMDGNRSLDSKLRRLYTSDYEEARKKLLAHGSVKSEAADEAFGRTSGQPQETRQVAAQAAIAAYVDLASFVDNVDEQLKIHLRCIAIHEEVHGVGAPPNQRLSDIASKAAEILFLRATGARWGHFVNDKAGRSANFRPDVFLKHREMIHTAARLSGKSVSDYSSLEGSLGVAYRSEELEKVLQTLHKIILKRDTPPVFPAPIQHLMAVYAGAEEDIAPEITAAEVADGSHPTAIDELLEMFRDLGPLVQGLDDDQG